jgi:hypothetical protein
MKKAIFIFLAFLPLLVFSQKEFEGIVTYKGFQSTEKKSFDFKLYLSKGKIKAKMAGNETAEEYSEQIHIYDFNTGIHYIIDDKAKTFAIDSLHKKTSEDFRTRVKDTSLPENILGYSCKGYNITPISASYLDDWNGISWFSDSLKFIVPVKYRGKRSMSTLADGNMLMLKSIMSFNHDEAEDEGDSLFIVADKIEKIKLDESEFLPPAGYILITEEQMDEIYQDSIKSDSVEIKELTLTELKQEEPKKTPAKPAKPTKSPAKKEKQKPIKG